MTAYNITILQKNASGELDTFYPATIAAQVTESESKQFVSAAKKTQYDENTVYSNATPIVEPIGQIAAGATFNETPVNQMLTKILYPYVAPTVSAVASTPSTVVEKGVTTTVASVTATVGKKSEDITKVELYKGANLVEAKTDAVASGGTISFTNAVAITDTTDLKVKVTDAQSTVIETVAAEYTYVYPFYHGVVDAGTTIDAAAVTALTKAVEEKGDNTFSFTMADKCAVIAYPKTYGALTAIVDRHGFDNLANFTRSEVSITCADSSSQAYYVYVKEAATATDFELTCKF